MQRRHFLQALGAAALVPAATASARQRPAGATVLYDGRAVALDRVSVRPPSLPAGTGVARRDGGRGAALWVRKRDLPRINEFELKPQGACRADICIPIPKEMASGDYFNLTAFAGKVGQSVVADTEARVWSFGEIPVVRGAFLESRVAPDFSVPDRMGRPVRLSSFRGKKVLVVTWASW